MNKEELKKIARTSDIRYLIDNYYRLYYKIPKIRKEIEKDNKKTYTKNQILNILYEIQSANNKFRLYNELEDENINEL